MPAVRRALRADVDAGRVLGDQVGGDVSHPGPSQDVGPEVHPRQRHRDPSGAGQHAVAELDQDLEPLGARARQRIDGAQRGGCGGRTVPESVDHTEQRGVVVVDADRDRLVAGDVLAR